MNTLFVNTFMFTFVYLSHLVNTSLCYPLGLRNRAEARALGGSRALADRLARRAEVPRFVYAGSTYRIWV